jgi:hypothetical protein
MNSFDSAGLWHYQPNDSTEFGQEDFDDATWPEMAIPQNWFPTGLDHHGALNHHDYRPGSGWLPSGQAYNTSGIKLAFPPLGVEKYCLTVDVEAADAQLLGHNQYTFQPLSAGKRGA